MLKDQADVVEPVQQSMTRGTVDFERFAQSLSVGHELSLQIDVDWCAARLVRALGEGAHERFGEHDRQQTVGDCIAAKDIGERRRDHGAKSVVGERPCRMFT